jgi:hypothetical protein
LCLVAWRAVGLRPVHVEGVNRDPRESPGSSFRSDPPWWDSQGLRSPAPRSLGRGLCGARPRPFRVGSTRGPTTRHAIEHARAWVRGEVKMMEARAAGGHAMGAARDLRGAARNAAYAAGQAGAVAPLTRTSWARPPMRSRPPVLLHRKARARQRGDSSVNGSVINCGRRFATSYWMTRGCGTTSAGRCLSAESEPRRAACSCSFVEPAAEDVGRDSLLRAMEQLAKVAPVAEDHVAQHEHRPRVAEHLDGGVDRHPDLGGR